MFDRQNDLARRALSGVDLLIDLATLGEYGLEPLAADGPCRERPGDSGARTRRSGASLNAGWEALFPTKARRGACRASQPVAVG